MVKQGKWSKKENIQNYIYIEKYFKYMIFKGIIFFNQIHDNMLINWSQKPLTNL